MFSSYDARLNAKKHLPKLVFDYIDGAAGREVAADENNQFFDKIKLQPRVLLNVTDRSLKKPFLGREYNLPIGIAPMGMCNLSHPNADKFLGEAAPALNIPICLSTAASTSVEDMHKMAPEHAWFQLYVGQSEEQSMELVDRAWAVGYRTLILTVDVPQVSRRVRDVRNGFKMPFRIGLRQFWDFARHPIWSLRTLMNGAPEPVNFNQTGAQKGFDRNASRAGADWTFLERLRAHWKGHLIVKGVTCAKDAIQISKAGADAIYVSNHGGRQLDSAPAAITVLPHIRDAVGPGYPLIFDSGVRNGEDVVKALALGADFVMLGRPLLFAIGADGRRGLASLLNIFAEEISLVMAQIGLTDVGNVTLNCTTDQQIFDKQTPTTSNSDNRKEA